MNALALIEREISRYDQQIAEEKTNVLRFTESAKRTQELIDKDIAARAELVIALAALKPEEASTPITSREMNPTPKRPVKK